MVSKVIYHSGAFDYIQKDFSMLNHRKRRSNSVTDCSDGNQKLHERLKVRISNMILLVHNFQLIYILREYRNLDQ